MDDKPFPTDVNRNRPRKAANRKGRGVVPEEAPALSHRLDFIKIEGFHQDGLLPAPGLLAQFSEGSGDEGRPIKREAATVAFLVANAVGGDQAERQGGLPVDKPARNTQVTGLCKSTVPQTTPE